MGRCYVVVGLGGVGRSGVGWSRVSGFGVGRILGAGGRSGDQEGEGEDLKGNFFSNEWFVQVYLSMKKSSFL